MSTHYLDLKCLTCEQLTKYNSHVFSASFVVCGANDRKTEQPSRTRRSTITSSEEPPFLPNQVHLPVETIPKSATTANIQGIKQQRDRSSTVPTVITPPTIHENEPLDNAKYQQTAFNSAETSPSSAAQQPFVINKEST